MPSQGAGLPLLLTGTVHVRDIPFTARADPELRLQDYRAAMQQWLRNRSVSRVVFCENSGFDLDSFSDLLEYAGSQGKQLELLSFEAPPYPSHRGKGYGEMLILRHALLHSEILQQGGLFIKVTGRYYVSNICAIIQGAELSGVDVMATLSHRLTFANSAVFCASAAFISDYLLPAKGDVDDSAGVYFEHVLARAIHRGMSEGVNWAPLPAIPRIQGVSGTSGLEYKHSFVRGIAGGILDTCCAYLSARMGC